MENKTEELQEISTLKENLYKDGSPVLISYGILRLNPESQGIVAEICFQNIQDKQIASLLVDIHIFDIANKEIEVIREHNYFGLKVNRGEFFGEDEEISITSAKAQSFSVAIRSVVFQDETSWEGSGSILFDSLPKLRKLVKEFEHEETADQYRRDFAQIADNKDVRAEYVPFSYRDLWLCSCGEINHSHEEKCFACGASFEPQKEMVNNRVQLATNLAEHKRLLAEKAEQERLEAERKAAAEAAAKAEAERLAAEAAAKAEAHRKRMIKIRNTAIAIAIPTVIAIIIYIIVYITYLGPLNNYNSATAMLNNGQYDNAITAFASLGGFQDSSDMVNESKYQLGLSQLNAGKYSEAIATFKEIEAYSDSKEQINECNYRIAGDLLTAEDFDNAVTMYETLGSYKDSADKLSGIYLSRAIRDIEDLDKSKESFVNLEEADSITMQQKYCDKGIELYNQGDETKALKYFALVSNETVLAQIDELYYQAGLKLIDNNDLDGAFEIFTNLGAYSDSQTQIMRIYYIRAEAELAENNWTTAIEFYNKTEGYQDSAEKIQLCNYNIARSNLNSGNYTEAEEQFKALGDYSDSATMALESRYQRGAALLNNGSVLDAYYTLYEIKNYSSAYALLVSNSQFYIYVYDVGVGPNPLDE